MTDPTVCDACGRTGWVLDGDWSKRPLCLELVPCLLPECEWSGRPIELLALPPDAFSVIARHPATGYLMSVSTGPPPVIFEATPSRCPTCDRRVTGQAMELGDAPRFMPCGHVDEALLERIRALRA